MASILPHPVVRRPPSRPLLFAESLERRALLASLGPDGTLSVVGTDAANVVTIGRTVELVSVTEGGVREEFPAEQVRRIEVSGGAGNDSLSLGGAGVGGEPLPVSFDGGAGVDHLFLFGTNGADRLRVTTTSASAGPPAGGGVSAAFPNVERLTADGLDGDDDLFLADTSGRFSQLLLSGALGDDTITVGDGLTLNEWRAGASQNSALLEGGPGDDALTYNDQASVGPTVSHGYLLMSTHLARGPGSRFNHERFERVTLNTGPNADGIEVLISPAPAPELWINAGRSDAPGPANPRTNRFADSLHAPWRANATNLTLTMSGPDAGRYVLAGHAPVNFAGIEELFGPDITRPEVTAATYRNAPFQEVEVRFSEDVGRSIGSQDMTVFNARGQVLFGSLARVPTQTGTPSVAVWRPSAALPPGAYRATIPAGAIMDANDNPLAENYAFEFVVPSAQVVDRHVFYNGSAYDNRDPNANAADDGAIATDKSALWVGGDASPAFDNVTSYAKGINGVMVDIAGLPGASLLRDHFVFEESRGGSLPEWNPAMPPRAISVRRGAGVNGSDRVTLVWTDYNPAIDSDTMALANGWLRVTVRATDNTGLAEPHVFYFGNLVGEIGDAFSRLRVSSYDVLQTRWNFFSEAPVTSRYDFNRDGRVGVTDFAISRRNLGRSLASPNVPIGPAPLSPASAAPREDDGTGLWDLVSAPPSGL